MPRSKSEPSRKRALPENEVPEASSLQDLVEQAEIDGVRLRMASGDSCELDLEAPVNGLARLDLDADDARAFSQLHAAILAKLEERLAGWGGVGDHSGRLRGYGYLPGLKQSEAHHRESVISMREYAGAQAATDAEANRRASVMLDASDIPSGFETALANLTRALTDVLPAKYRHVLCADELVSCQPNLHRGRAYLRPHLDEPLHDGFGIVIVTVAIRGSARILLHERPWDAKRRRERWFRLREGQASAAECHGSMLIGARSR